MENVKRIEIITEALETREVISTLTACGVTGYSVIAEVTGAGDRGVQSGDELTDVFKNSLVLAACPPELVPRVVEAIRPLLVKRGGVCLVSDAQWVRH